MQRPDIRHVSFLRIPLDDPSEQALESRGILLTESPWVSHSSLAVPQLL